MATALVTGARGFAGAWLGGFGLALVAGVLAMRIPETEPMIGGATPTPLVHRAAIGPGLALFAGVAAMTGFFALGGPHAARLGLEAWSMVFVVFGGVVVVSRIAFARLPDRLPPMRVVAIALLACAAGTTVAAAASGVATLLVGAAILAVGVALLTPAVFAAIFGMVPSGERGAAAGTASAFIDLAFGGGRPGGFRRGSGDRAGGCHRGAAWSADAAARGGRRLRA